MIDNQPVTIAGQVGSHFGVTFNPPFNVYPIDTTNIASFSLYPVVYP